MLPPVPAEPEQTIVDWTAHLPSGASVLDLAAGGGRHARWFVGRGHPVTAVDRDAAALRAIDQPGIRIVEADLENAPWPLQGLTFGAVVVVNYLWRPLLPHLCAAIEPGGLLLYETFGVGNERFGRPRNPDFLLRDGELRDVAGQAGLEVIDYAHGPIGDPAHAVRQRLLARRPC